MFLEDNKLNLIMAYPPGFIDPVDFQNIRDHIEKLSSRIRVHIVPDRILGSSFPDAPTLTFSPAIIRLFKPPRGPVFCGKAITKPEQMRLLSKGGIRVPKWAFLEAHLSFPEAEWGPLVIIKPSAFGHASKGRGIELVRTASLRYQPPLAYPADHPGRKGKMIVQKFVDSGDFSEDFRVVTLFGSPLYALQRRSLIKMERPAGDLPTTAGVVSNAGASDQREVHLCYDKDILAYASKIYQAIPNVPFQAVDIRRERLTGRLYCFEINPGGNTWNFSLGRAKIIPTIDGKRREDQFGAWEIAAKSLIEVTCKLAN
jgi:hypothetical protein